MATLGRHIRSKSRNDSAGFPESVDLPAMILCSSAVSGRDFEDGRSVTGKTLDL